MYQSESKLSYSSCCQADRVDSPCCHADRVDSSCCHADRVDPACCHANRVDPSCCHADRVDPSCCHADLLGADMWRWMPPFPLGDVTALEYEGGEAEGRVGGEPGGGAEGVAIASREKRRQCQKHIAHTAVTFYPALTDTCGWTYRKEGAWT